MKRTSFLLLSLFAAPFYAMASVEITEVMYDPPASDAGHEWIEITNTGSTSVDLTGYKLFEADTNHTLTLLSGTTTLSPGTSALIVKDQSKFLADYAAFSGALFKSTFSLSNTGEVLAIKDEKLNVLDSIQYASGMGAAGNGESLHRESSGTSLAAGLPDPDVFNPSEPLVHKKVAAPAIATSKAATTKSASKAKTSVSTGTKTSSTSVHLAAAAAPTSDSFPISEPLLGVAALVLLGVAGALYARPVATNTEPEEFDI